VTAIVEEWGRIDILVNAQILLYKTVRNLTEDGLESMWQSGPVATLRFQKGASPICARPRASS